MIRVSLTCEEAEHRSGIPASTWRRWISEGRLTSTLIKGRRFIPWNEASQLAVLRHERRCLPSKRS